MTRVPLAPGRWPSTRQRLDSSFSIGRCGTTVQVSKGFAMPRFYRSALKHALQSGIERQRGLVAVLRVERLVHRAGLDEVEEAGAEPGRQRQPPRELRHAD